MAENELENVTSIKDFKKSKLPKKATEKEEFDFSEIIEKNKKIKEREKRSRRNANKGVVRSHRLKK